ncbi:hypothetical protein A2Z53_00105 [Candidatus Giovannonibacteria bacterium RIFCSPHIGHO2_02_42_15]|uniref:Uncharacterized protein n=1 Tax=Candidatus Giovannonibacteria bacterium RIFCSPHIGHO2_02_42_15 TaxID=1798329 RepID=A0A1F5VN35_9BACT|nr:MAG: hypothetical protein A2Z53_00105 [Candidatus Giovannonibacteria bacterium RIFCSPHIGHO2_02_42_15]
MRKHIGELGGQYFFSDIRLPTGAALARAMIINVAVDVAVLLMFCERLGGNEATAVAAMQ